MKAVPSGIWRYLVLAFAAVVIYLPSLDGPFLLDDNWKIVRNPVVHGEVPVPLTSRYIGDQSFRVNYLAGGLNPRAWRMVNVLIHAAAAVTLFALLARIHSVVSGVAMCTCSTMAGPAWWVAFLWAVHPLQTESVAYICQRFESLAGLFYLLTVYGFVRAVSGSRWWYRLSILACICGMATKETVATAPLMILLLDGAVLSGSWREALHRNWRLHVGYVLTWGVLAMLWMGTMAEGIRAGQYGVSVLSPWRYWITQNAVIVHYLRLTLLPIGLCFDYAWPWAESIKDVWLQFLALALLVLGTVVAVKRRNPLGVCIAVFLLLLTPTSTVIPLYDAAAEHRLYLPLAGILCAVVFAVWHVTARYGMKPGVMSGACAGLRVLLAFLAGVCLTFATLQRLELYEDDTAMWTAVSRHSPDNLRAWNELATAFLERGEWTEAERCSNEVVVRTRGIVPVNQPVVLSPHSPVVNRMHARANMGTWALAHGDLAVALDLLSEAVALYPFAPEIEQKLLAVLRKQGVTESSIEISAKAAVANASRRLCAENAVP